MKKLYASFDIEADGLSPYNSNMVELGISFLDESGIEVDSFYSAIKRIPGKEGTVGTIKWLEKNGVWKRAVEGPDVKNPHEVFAKLVTKLRELSKEYEISWVSYPAAYDWMWLKHYWTAFVKEDDQSLLTYYSICLDSIIDFYAIDRKLTGDQKSELWNKLKKGKEHTHNALDDAREQGNVFIGLMKMI